MSNMSDIVAIIDEDDWNAALNDPRVHELHRQAAEYAESLIARGHCRCHLVVEWSCPNREKPSNEGFPPVP